MTDLHFNLVSEPWIPCELSTGGRSDRSLADTLTHAHELRSIQDQSPLVTASLHRLLLAVLHRCFGPADIEEWKALYKRGCFDAEILERYLAAWRHRFDLFHPERPFYQCIGMVYEPKSAHLLVTERSTYGAPVYLFEHRPEGIGRSLTPAEAARLVVATQAFALGGLMTRGVGDPPSAKAAPLALGAMVLLSGANLFETLMLNLLTAELVELAIPTTDAKKNVPAWEQDSAARIERRSPHGWLELLTWQSRRILLLPRQNEGAVRVERVIVAGGVDLEQGELRDPMMAWKTLEKIGWKPVAFDTERVLFRDATALFRMADKDRGGYQPPAARDQLAGLIQRRALPGDRQYAFDLFGLVSNQAKVLLFRHERMPLPASFLIDPDKVGALKECLEKAEEVHRALRDALRDLAQSTLSPGYDPAKRTGRQPLADDVRKLMSATGAVGAFWARLRERFDVLVLELDQDETRARQAWRRALRAIAEEMYREATNALGATGRALKGAARGEQVLHREINKSLKEATV